MGLQKHIALNRTNRLKQLNIAKIKGMYKYLKMLLTYIIFCNLTKVW